MSPRVEKGACGKQQEEPNASEDKHRHDHASATRLQKALEASTACVGEGGVGFKRRVGSGGRVVELKRRHFTVLATELGVIR